MKSFVSPQTGRVVVIHLGKGELLLESIQEELARLGIKDAVVLSAIGSMRKAAFHIITNTEALSVNEYITLEKPMEIGAIQGIILDGVPHLHIVCSDTTRAYTGHLENATEIQYLAEICIMEICNLNLTRQKDALGIDFITKKA